MWKGEYRLLTDFEFRIVSYKPSFFPSGENEVKKHNLQYGPRKRD